MYLLPNFGKIEIYFYNKGLFLYLAKHPKNDYSEFILPNASTLNHCSKELNCSINYRDTKFESNCVLKAEGPYKLLQWTIDSTDYIENQVIAYQSFVSEALFFKALDRMVKMLEHKINFRFLYK